MEKEPQQSAWMACSVTERGLQPYFEEVVDEDFSIFARYKSEFEPDSTTSSYMCDYDDFELDVGKDSDHHSLPNSPTADANQDNSSKSWQNDGSVPRRRRRSDEESPERRVKMRMETDRPSDENMSFEASFASEVTRRSKANATVRKITSERHRKYVQASEQRKQVEQARAALLPYPVEAGLSLQQRVDLISPTILIRWEL